MYKERIGLFGGTFNPIHYGHLFIVNCTKECLGLDKIIFIPSNIPPHKNIKENSIHHRANMVDIAIKDDSKFSMSKIEMFRDGKSYTIDTLEYFSNKFSDCEIFFIMGSDVFNELIMWKRYKDILQNYKLIVVSRGISEYFGWNTSQDKSVVCIYPPNLKEINRDKCFNAYIIAICLPTMINISSTMIRKFIKENISVRYLLPDSVIDYINQHNLYRKD